MTTKATALRVTTVLGDSITHLRGMLALSLLLAACVQAQDITKGSLAGVVHDPMAMNVSGATVKLTSPYGDRETTTNAAGEYSFLNLVVGTGYNLEVTQRGFAPSVAKNITVG